MLVKRLKAKETKSAVRSAPKAARKTKILKPEFTPEEVATFERQVALHQQSEKAWQRLAAPPEGDERWTDVVEESLLHKTEHRDHAAKWKYFSK
jgi:predicted outer membrane protein